MKQSARKAKQQAPVNRYEPYSVEYAVFELEHGRHFDPEELAVIVRTSPNEPFPSILANYIADALEGKIKRKRGRKPRTAALEDFENSDAECLYRYLLHRYKQEADHLKQVAKSRGDVLPMTKLSPHQKARRATTKWVNLKWRVQGKKRIDEHTLMNRLSKRR